MGGGGLESLGWVGGVRVGSDKNCQVLTLGGGGFGFWSMGVVLRKAGVR